MTRRPERRRRTVLPLPPSPRARSATRTAPYSRDEVLARWGGCAYCDGPAEELDHVVPLGRGGRDVESNVVAVCSRCNGAKSDLPLAAWAVTANTDNG